MDCYGGRSLSETKPAKDNKAFRIFKRGETVIFNNGDNEIWIFSAQINGLVNINPGIESPLFIVDRTAKTAFDENANSEITPIFQINATYGIFSDVLTVTDKGSSGTTTTVNNMYTCDTGIAADGLSSILSFRQLKVRQGQGGGARLTSVFTAPKAGSQQAAGLITAEDLFVFGFIGTAFGIIHAFDGEAEHEELTIDTAAAGAETATVTIDGTDHIISLTLGSATAQHTAFEIAKELNAIPVPNYIITSNDDQVIAQALISGPQGSFSFSSTGTAAGTWDQITVGVEVTVNFTPQASWNQNTRLVGQSQCFARKCLCYP